MNHVHHVHLFASNLEKSLEVYQEAFGGKIILDEDMVGARNVFMRIGGKRRPVIEDGSDPDYPIPIHPFAVLGGAGRVCRARAIPALKEKFLDS